MEKPVVKRIEIENLNQKSFSIPIKDNKLILVEPSSYNTMHKIIHLIYLFCNGCIDKINESYNINSISITYRNDKIKLFKSRESGDFLVKDKYEEKNLINSVFGITTNLGIV